MCKSKQANMTDGTAPPFAVNRQSQVPVKQIDREAYNQIAIVGKDASRAILEGDWDRWEGVQAFARHRLLVERTTAKRCAEIAHGETSLDCEFPYDRGRSHACIAILEAWPEDEAHNQFCVCATCIDERSKYMTEC